MYVDQYKESFVLLSGSGGDNDDKRANAVGSFLRPAFHDDYRAAAIIVGA